MSQARTIDNQFLYEQLFIFVKKNRAIYDFVASIENDASKQQKTEQLFLAIQSGDSKAAIFTDPDCYLFLLFLIKHNKISFWHGMTVYFYLLSLMQITFEDNRWRNVKVDNLCENGQIQDKYTLYLERICERLPEGENVVDELKELVLRSSPSEQWILQISCRSNYYSFDQAIFQLAMSGSVPFIMIAQGGNRAESILWLPSFTIIKFCLQKISPDHMEPLFSFGAIGVETLKSLHQANKHPVPIYSPLVKSSLIEAHGFQYGPLGIALHDLGHVSWGSSLPLLFRHKIYHIYFPLLEGLKARAIHFGNAETVKTLDDVMKQLNDFDLLTIHVKDATFRCIKYLESCFQPDGPEYQVNTATILGSNKCYDLLYFLMVYQKHLNTNLDEDVIKFWDIATDAVKRLVDKSRGHSEISFTLTTLALHAASNSVELIANLDSIPKYLDWQGLLTLLQSTDGSEKIWNDFRYQFHDELLFLITKCRLLFFHPYFPLTEAKKFSLINLIQSFIEKTKKEDMTTSKTTTPHCLNEAASLSQFGLYKKQPENVEQKDSGWGFKCQIL